MEKEFSSSLLENAVNEFAHLPGIGRKTALRLVLHLLREDEQVAFRLGESLIRLRKEIKYCNVCHNISETELCPICANPARDATTVCVVENVKDVTQYIGRIDEMIERKRSFMEAHGLLEQS